MTAKSCLPARPNRTKIAGLVLRVAAASADNRPAYRRRHAEAAGRQRARLADTLAAGGVGRPAGRAAGRPPGGEHRSKRWTVPGLWGRLLPEWDAVRDLPPRDVSHKWTVDRHIVETVVNAAPLTTRVARSDLLALGALLHDIGKGRGVDHCVLGADLVIPIGERLGLSPQDVDTLSGMVRHHLLLPVTATRSDLNDPETIRVRGRGAGRGCATARTAARARGGGLEGHRAGRME